MTYDILKQKRESQMPEPSNKAKKLRLNRHGQIDGRQARATYKERQFNPRVRDQFIADFKGLQEELQAQSEEKVTQAYVLELLMATYQQSVGREVNPFGLSDEALEGAMQIAEHNNWTLAVVLEDAISARCKHFNLLRSSGSK
jgi:hypothetical protein